MKGDGLPPLRDVIARHGLAARRSLGQNFLLDLNLTAKIARAAKPLDGHDILEIGPGPGGLTRSLLAEGARRVVALERDRRCLPALKEIEQAYPDRLCVVEGDALVVDPLPYLRRPTRIVANLPYNIGTELLVRWLTPKQWPPYWDSMTLMFQKEVAQRIVAQAGTKAYGRLSILAQWRCDVRLAFDVPPRAFTPAPKVTSSIVQFERLPQPRFEADAARLSKIVAGAFGQRRKMLRSSLKGVLYEPEVDLKRAEIEPTERAEQVSLEAFCRLSRVASLRP